MFSIPNLSFLSSGINHCKIRVICLRNGKCIRPQINLNETKKTINPFTEDFKNDQNQGAPEPNHRIFWIRFVIGVKNKL